MYFRDECISHETSQQRFCKGLWATLLDALVLGSMKNQCSAETHQICDVYSALQSILRTSVPYHGYQNVPTAIMGSVLVFNMITARDAGQHHTWL